MAKATNAIMYHYASTKEKPQYNFCPVGKNSWCLFQRDVANKTNLYKPIKNPFPPAITNVIKPLFHRLGDEHFLAGCKKCVTQNPNESLHHVTWELAPKEQYTSSRGTSLAVGLGFLLLNSGLEVTYTQLLLKIGPSVSSLMINSWEDIDEKRIYSAGYKEKPEINRSRKKNKRQKVKKADALVHQEGVQYQSQGFYEANTETAPVRSQKKGEKKVIVAD